jgi:hypothetical protein
LAGGLDRHIIAIKIYEVILHHQSAPVSVKEKASKLPFPLEQDFLLIIFVPAPNNLPRLIQRSFVFRM